MEELTTEEWNRVEDASWAGGTRAWKATVNEILTERLDTERDRIMAEFRKAADPSTTGVWREAVDLLETVTYYRQRHAEGIQGAEPDLTVIDESRLFTSEKPIPVDLAELAMRRTPPPRPTCPACGKVYHAVSEEITPKVRRLCEKPADDREDGKRYRRYEPCGHVVEVAE